MKGIDLSTYQRNVNYLNLKASGIDFAIIRAGFGKNESQKDNMFEEHFMGLNKVGIKIGIYHYSYVSSIDNAILEAKNCLSFIKDKHFELPIFYDLEESCITKLGKKLITECAIAFCKEIEKAGYKAGVYASLNWFNNFIDVNKLIEKGYKIWCAQWNNEFTGNFKIDYWQYTSKGKVHGIQGNVDLDISYDDSENNSSINTNVMYTIGKTYTLQVDLNVRAGVGTQYKIKNYYQLTKDGRKNAYKQWGAVLKKGTKVTCLDIIFENNNIWLKIPSGYICGYYNGKIYVE